MNFRKKSRPYAEYNFTNSPSSPNVKLQNPNTALQPISRCDAEINELRANERCIKPPTYQQIDRLESAFVNDSSTPLSVSLLYESVSLNFQVSESFG